MKKLFAILAIAFMVIINPVSEVFGQNETTQTEQAAEPQKEKGHELMKRYFIEGGVAWMTPVLICLILGLAIVIEKIISLGLSTVNSKKFLASIESELSKGNVEGAKNICKATRGPVASICYQGLARVKEGVDIVEKSLVSYGSVQMGLLERGLSWISLFIALAPMLGFMGTVVGMIEAFDAIAAAGDISPTLVAGGIKVALLTTVFGLVVAIILQIFYNYIVSRVDSLVNDMEDSSITFMDMILKYNVSK
jgi:biopolymer transport protein ExbB